MLAIPQAICSMILVAVAATLASQRWDQEVLEYMADEYSEGVILDMKVVDFS